MRKPLTAETIHARLKRRYKKLERECGPAVTTLLTHPDPAYVQQHLPGLQRILQQDRGYYQAWYFRLVVYSVTLRNDYYGTLAERAIQPAIDEAENIVKYLDCLLDDLRTLEPKARRRTQKRVAA